MEYKSLGQEPYFSITGEIKEIGRREPESCGCIHDDIKKHFPELKHLIKWHLTSAKEPMHYIANSMYHAKNGFLELARESAVWPEAELLNFTEENLKNRLPSLMVEFHEMLNSVFGNNKGEK